MDVNFWHSKRLRMTAEEGRGESPVGEVVGGRVGKIEEEFTAQSWKFLLGWFSSEELFDR